jgi:hypothetical protein
MFAIHWRRGFFGLWAAFAVLWFTLAAYLWWSGTFGPGYVAMLKQEDCRALARAAVPADPRPVRQWSDQELLEAWKTLKRREEECFEAQRVATARDVARARQAVWERLVLLFGPPVALLGLGVTVGWILSGSAPRPFVGTRGERVGRKVRAVLGGHP